MALAPGPQRLLVALQRRVIEIEHARIAAAAAAFLELGLARRPRHGVGIGRRRGPAAGARSFLPAHYRVPVLPKPPAPRSLAANSSTMSKPTCRTGTTSSWAIRSKGSIVKAVSLRFQTDTISWPW